MNPASRIAERFARLRDRGKKAFVPYLTAGDPDLETTLALARMLEREGADILELGVPFTDPIADGPVNQRAAQRALDRGVTPGDVLESIGELRRTGFELPIVLFTYSNPLLRLQARGPLEGVDGILVTDLPPEEAKKVPSAPGSLEESLEALRNDHEFLLKGDVFSKDLIEAWIDWKYENEVVPVRTRPTPWEFMLYYDI